ncbi:MAG: CRISPR-associated protein Csx17, partial [Verrucomicrobiales bacterium]
GIDEIEQFFLSAYSPSPFMSPWNRGSGFFPKPSAQKALVALEESKASRFGNYRHAIKKAKAILGDRINKKPTDPEREEIRLTCKKLLSGELGGWMDAVFMLEPDLVGGQRAVFPSMLGSGGNDGNLEFANNFMQRVGELFDTGDADGGSFASTRYLLRGALHGTPTCNLNRGSIGQFSPGGVGSRPNGTAGFKGDALHNPWDFLLMLEGATLFASSTTRSYDVSNFTGSSVPFAFRSTAAGGASITFDEKRDGGEQWMPLWRNPASLVEVRSLLREGRGRVGTKTARSATEFARSVARLGVSRGIVEFERFGYLTRHGKSNIATPLGRWKVAAQPHQNLLDEVAPWVDRLSTMGADKRAPESIRVASRNAQESLLRCCQQGQSGENWRRLAAAISDALLQHIPSVKFVLGKKARPLPSISPEWLQLMDDGSTEFHLASALASQHSMESFWLPVAGRPQQPFFLQRDDAFKDQQRRLVAKGINLVDDLVGIVNRRRTLVSQEIEDDRIIQPHGVRDLDTIAQFLRGDTEDDKILRLIPFLSAVRWKDVPRPIHRPDFSAAIPSNFAVIRLATIGRVRIEGHDMKVRMDSETLRRLASGDLRGASQIAIRRLKASGLYPVVRELHGDSRLARRLAASLSFSCHPASVSRLYRKVIKPGSLEILSTENNDSNEELKL